MKAMILAAGLGTRMRPLTDHTPKPLLSLGRLTLIELHLERLALAGFSEVVINVSHLADKIIDYLEDEKGFAKSLALDIEFSREEEPLETAGGIRKALPLLGKEPFLVLNGDVWVDMDLSALRRAQPLQEPNLAYLYMVPVPEYYERGDYSLDQGKISLDDSKALYTFSGISVLSPKLFAEGQDVPRLADLWQPLIERGLVEGELYQGEWMDVGTPERLETLRQRLKA